MIERRAAQLMSCSKLQRISLLCVVVLVDRSFVTYSERPQSSNHVSLSCPAGNRRKSGGGVAAVDGFLRS